MTDRELMERLARQDGTTYTVGIIAANRIRELRRDLNRANQRIGLFLHHASKKKAKK
jgi:hypothetical protein